MVADFAEAHGRELAEAGVGGLRGSASTVASPKRVVGDPPKRIVAALPTRVVKAEAHFISLAPQKFLQFNTGIDDISRIKLLINHIFNS
jgi:hypothetical protein